jgi:hypothetical protein
MSALGSQEDAYRPSLFELVAQEKLKELLQPAVQYILAVCISSASCFHPFMFNNMYTNQNNYST